MQDFDLQMGFRPSMGEGEAMPTNIRSETGSDYIAQATVTAYLSNGGATTDYAVLCAVKNNKTGKERNIYWNYHCSTATIKWVDDKTVSINGIELYVTKDLYDYRRN